MTALFNHFLLLADFHSLPFTLSLFARCYRCSFYDDTFSYANAREFFSLERIHVSFYICTSSERIPFKSLFKYFKNIRILVSNTCVTAPAKPFSLQRVTPGRANRFNQTAEDLNLKPRRAKSTVCKAQALITANGGLSPIAVSARKLPPFPNATSLRFFVTRSSSERAKHERHEETRANNNRCDVQHRFSVLNFVP